MGMAKKQVDCGRILANINAHAARSPPKMPIVYQGSPPRKIPNKNELIGEPDFHRLSPVKGYPRSPVRSPQGSLGSSPRTSPGLLAGHYAGCKFSEPPSPSALPLPPKHWTQTTRSVRLPFHTPKSDYIDMASQLKIMLKVQA